MSNVIRVTHSQDLLAGSSQQDGAGFRIFTLSDEGEILVSDLLHLKQPRPQTQVLLTQLVRTAHDAGAARPEGGRGEERERERDTKLTRS